MLARLEKGEVCHFVGEVGGEVIAGSDLHTGKGSEKHVGVIGIVIKKGFRDLGIGSQIMRALVEQAKKMGLKILTLSVYATNERAIHVYEKVGFVKTGRVPKKHFREGKYIDEITMARLLE